MRIHYLNLDRRPDREELFRRRNARAGDLARAHCIDGPTLGNDGLKALGVDRPSLIYYTHSTIGNQLSHLGQWRNCVATDAPRTIAEDDALFHRDFADQAPELLEQLPNDYDIMFWGWTFGCWLSIEFIEGARSIHCATSAKTTEDEIAAWQESVYTPQTFRTWGLWNSFAYTISPAGAKRLIELCQEFRNENGRTPLNDELFPIYGVDAKIAALCAGLSAWVAFPPLAYHPHDKSDTDMLEDEKPIRDTRSKT